MPDITLLNEDCMTYMKGCKDNAFDLVVTSPPYNMNLRINAKGSGYCSRQITKELSTKYENYNDNLPMDEYEDFLCKSVSEMVRVSDLVFLNIQMITGNKPALFSFIGKFSNQIKEVIVWDKCKAQPAIGEGVLNSGYEFIIVLGGNPITRAFDFNKFGRGELSNVWRIPSKSSADDQHRASYPFNLVATVLENFNGVNVFDPFLGTGTSAIAAHRYGRDFVGTEIDPDYFAAAQQRFDHETRQETMF